MARDTDALRPEPPGPAKVGVAGAMRARDVSRPSPEEQAAAERADAGNGSARPTPAQDRPRPS